MYVPYMSLFSEIDKGSGIPFYIQLSEQIRLLVHEGRLGAGDPLPTVRELAVELEVNANTVARVYRDLQQAGVLDLRRGVGTFVSDKVVAKTRELEEQGRLLDSVLSGMSQAVFLLEADRSVSYANAAAADRCACHTGRPARPGSTDR